MSTLTQQGQVFNKPHLGPFLVTSQGPLCHKEPSLPMGQSQDPVLPPATIRAYGQLRSAFSRAVCVSLPSRSRRGAMLAGVESPLGADSHHCVWTQLYTPPSPQWRGAPHPRKEVSPRHAQAAWGLNPSSNTLSCVIWAIGKSSLCLSVPICKRGVIDRD